MLRTEVDHAVLIAAAWAEHDAARAEYVLLKRQVRTEGASRRSAARRGRVIGARARLSRAWMALHELGEVPLENNRRGHRRGQEPTGTESNDDL